jgi:hypothetical protein
VSVSSGSTSRRENNVSIVEVVVSAGDGIGTGEGSLQAIIPSINRPKQDLIVIYFPKGWFTGK